LPVGLKLGPPPFGHAPDYSCPAQNILTLSASGEVRVRKAPQTIAKMMNEAPNAIHDL
jgi:hypothetical protein